MRALLLLTFAACAPQGTVLNLPAHERDRRFVVGEWTVDSKAVELPIRLRSQKTGEVIPCQWESEGDKTIVRWIVKDLPAGEKRAFRVERATERDETKGMTLKEDPGGWISVHAPGREITRYHIGAPARKFKRPFFYPLVGHGVSLVRGFPMEPKEGETPDHPHHTSIYNVHGDVNGRDYWHKVPVAHRRMLRKVAGPVYARLTAENRWGEDLTEIQDVFLFNAGDDGVMDWTITLRAENGPVTLGKTKEGTFVVRVAAGLTGKGGGRMIDAKGHVGEPAIRKDNAPWVDYSGVVDGKKVGIAVMAHPKSFRAPTHWQVRAYGLFAANPFIISGEHRMKKGEAITLRYRIYVHGGDAEAGNVAETFAGYAAESAASK